jgi:hypothetical protein
VVEVNPSELLPAEPGELKFVVRSSDNVRGRHPDVPVEVVTARGGWEDVGVGIDKKDDGTVEIGPSAPWNLGIGRITIR